MLVVRESSETRRNAFEVYKVFAFASPHICVLCVVGDTSLPQTSCSGCVVCLYVCVSVCVCLCVCARAPLLQHTHLHFIHVGKIFFLPSELLSPCFADKQKQGGAVLWGLVQGLGGRGGGCVVGLCDTDKI